MKNRLARSFVPLGIAALAFSSVVSAAQLCPGAPGDKVSLFGFSAGGAAALFALAERKTPVSAAVIVNASTGLSASVEAYEHATRKQYTWSEYTRELTQRTDAVQRAADIARGRLALLIVQGGNDTMISGKDASALFNALQPYYKESGETQRLRLHLVDGLAHTFAESERIDELRRTIAEWFNTAAT